MTSPSVHDAHLPDDIAQYRPRLLGLAYRMLGDLDDAEDVVQDTFLRWHREPRDDIRSPEAWLVRVASRLALDRLRHAQVERAAYVGQWLPEPIALSAAGAAPDHGAELASDLSVALLVLLERLAPEERAAFVLREVFGTDYAEIARILERRPDAVRQMVHRARQRVLAGRPRVPASVDAQQGMLERFVSALAADDANAVLALLAPDVTATSDGGGVATAARNRIEGADHVARFLLGLVRKNRGVLAPRFGQLNGQPALLLFQDAQLVTATMLDVGEGGIHAVFLMVNPEKLEHAAGAPVAIA